jgi:membrane-bound ClpP family serine protease
MEMVVGVVIGILVYLAIGVVVLARAEGRSVLDQIVSLDIPTLLGTLAWPLLLVFRRRDPVATPGQTGPAPPDHGFLGADAEAVTDLRPWGKVRVGEHQLDARADTGFVAAGARVRVVGIDRGGLVVRRDSA